MFRCNNLLCNKKADHHDPLWLLVEMRGVEPLSKKPVPEISPSAVTVLEFKQSIVQEQTAFADSRISFPQKSRTSFIGILLVDVSLRS